MPFRTLHRIFASPDLPVLRFCAVLLICAFADRGTCRFDSRRGHRCFRRRVTGATVDLISNGQVVGSAVSGADGSFQITDRVCGAGSFSWFRLQSFRQLETPGFYAGQLDNIERNIVLEPEWVHESIVVTATGTPTPQPQTGAATSVIGPQRTGTERRTMVSSLRLMPGTFVVQSGQRGAQSSLFVRGGDSDDNLVLIDGVNAGDLGGRFDFGPLSTTALRADRGLSRAELEPLRRGCRERRCEYDDAAWHHQLSVAYLSRRLGKFPELA